LQPSIDRPKIEDLSTKDFSVVSLPFNGVQCTCYVPSKNKSADSDVAYEISAEPATRQEFLAMIKSLNLTCLTLHKFPFSYQICFMEGNAIRVAQFNEREFFNIGSTVLTGNLEDLVTGLPIKVHKTSHDFSYKMRSGVSGILPVLETRRFQLEIDEGDLCEFKHRPHRNRKGTVQFQCGAKNEFLMIYEPQDCVYVVLVTLACPSKVISAPLAVPPKKVKEEDERRILEPIQCYNN
jgi:hypothetical protein